MVGHPFPLVTCSDLFIEAPNNTMSNWLTQNNYGVAFVLVATNVPWVPSVWQAVVTLVVDHWKFVTCSFRRTVIKIIKIATTTGTWSKVLLLIAFRNCHEDCLISVHSHLHLHRHPATSISSNPFVHHPVIWKHNYFLKLYFLLATLTVDSFYMGGVNDIHSTNKNSNSQG